MAQPSAPVSAAAPAAAPAAALYVRPALLDTLQAKLAYAGDAGSNSVFELISDNLRAIAEKRDEYLFQMVLNAQDPELRKRDSARWAAFEIDLASLLFNSAESMPTEQQLVIQGLADSRAADAQGSMRGIVEFWDGGVIKPANLEARAANMMAAYRAQFPAAAGNSDLMT